MNKIYVNELNNYIDKDVVFSGFVDTIRDKKWVMFVILRDSTGKVQMTIEKSVEENSKLLEIMNNLIAQLTAPVKWTQIIQNMVKDGLTEVVELGPGAVLQGLVKKIDSSVATSGKQ